MCLAYTFIIAMAPLNGDSKYKSYRSWHDIKNLLKYSRMLPVLVYIMTETLKNLGSFRNTVRSAKLLCLTALAVIGLCLVEVPYRTGNYTSYVIRTITLQSHYEPENCYGQEVRM